MFCLISSLSALFLLISLILARIHPFPVSLGSHERREVIKKKEKKRKEEKQNEWMNNKKEEKELYATIRSESIFSKAIAHVNFAWILTFSLWFDIKLLLYFYDDRDYKYIHIYTHNA